jgi:hypothetical protein
VEFETVLWRVLPEGAQDVTPEQVLARHLAALGRRVGPPTDPRSPFSGDLAASAAEPTLRLEQALRRAGRADLAAQLAPD